MKLNQLKDNKGARQGRVRVGRGIGSGLGKTAGRGQKGAKSRSGVSIAGFEGGQMPLHMRLPKRGFNNIFAKDYAEVNVGLVQKAIDAKKLDAKGTIDHAALKAAGLARGGKDGVRLLGKGELTAKLGFKVAGASKGAREAVEKAGGSIELIVPKDPAELAAAKKGSTKAAATPGKPTSAQISAVKSNCRSDYPKVCAGVPTGGAAALDCLEKNKAKLSAACGKAVAAAGGGAAPANSAAPASANAAPAAAAPGAATPAPAPLVLRPMLPREILFVARSACGPDVRALCAGVPAGGGRIIECLASQPAALSPACRDVLGRFAAR